MQELNPLLHSQLRLAVMSVLLNAEEADFVYLKEKMEQKEALEAQMMANGQMPAADGQQASGASAAHLKDSGSGLNDLADLPSAS